MAIDVHGTKQIHQPEEKKRFPINATWRYLVTAFLVLHGLIHAIGFAASWQLGGVSGVTTAPSFPSLAAGSSAVLILGVLWLVAGAGFIVGGVGLAASRAWCVPVTTAAALLSLVLTAMWWQSAPVGIAIDVVILGFLLVAGRVKAVRFGKAQEE